MPGRGSEERREEFERVALPHLDQVYGTAAHLAGDPDRASDLTQETLLRAFRFFHQFTPGTNCRAWLLTILHNTFRNRYRSERRERSQTDIDDPLTAAEAASTVDARDDPEHLVLENVLDDEVSEALRSLPEEFRDAVVLVDLQELTYEESARVLDCPIGTVRSRLSRGRRLLAARLRSYAVGRGIVRK